MKGPVKDYGQSALTGQIDKLYALASQHTNLDAQKAFEKMLPAIQKITEMAKQFAPKPPMNSTDMVYMQTSMAETQRRAAKDQADNVLAHEKMQSESLQKNRAQQIEIALNANDNLTDERIKTAEISHDAQILQSEQQKTAISALQGAQQTLGGQYGGT
jgi:hypothetical protein